MNSQKNLSSCQTDQSEAQFSQEHSERLGSAPPAGAPPFVRHSDESDAPQKDTMKRHPSYQLITGAIVIAVVAALVLVGYINGTGFAGKTAWDWLNLLGAVAIPVGVGAAAIWFNRQQMKLDHQQAERQMELNKKQADNAEKLNAESIQAQNYVKTIEYERQIEFNKKIEEIRNLSGTYDEASYGECREAILGVVNFLNDVAHLVRYCYVNQHDILLQYAPALDTCREKLIQAGWLEKERENRGEDRYFLHFQVLCHPYTHQTIWRGGRIWWFDPTKEKEIERVVRGEMEEKPQPLIPLSQITHTAAGSSDIHATSSRCDTAALRRER